MTYEYKCKNCGHLWEADQKITDPALTQCPKCLKDEALRLISLGQGFQLKGSGWFKSGGY